ncbi:MAG: ABC transporter ATP-binding protein [Acidobacteria bacterium]|nr:ABC transporter ATP-binding protein [Acidobacteriota bacterium]
MTKQTEALLDVRDLRTYFFTRRGVVNAVDGVSFTIEPGRTLGLVGESGCGKSVTGLSILRLISPPGQIIGGEILFTGTDLLKLDKEAMRRHRGKKIAMIFQDPMTSLNPVYTVGYQIAEAILVHNDVSKREAWNRAIELMRAVAIPDAERRAKSYPHELSGGMRQRVMIAMAISCNPELLIADEPTTALDVTIQAQILELLAKLREELSLSMLLITHDLGVVAETTDHIAVMYAGKVVEIASTREIFKNPQHPYTIGLLRCAPSLTSVDGAKRRRLETIEGVVPSLVNLPPGCPFSSRCPEVQPACREGEIMFTEVSPGHLVRCVPRGSEVRSQTLVDLRHQASSGASV